MENLNLLLFLSIAIPLGMMLFICKGKTRLFVAFLLLGIVTALFCGELNGMLAAVLPFDTRFFSTDLAPITEELTKAIPIIFFALVFKPERQTLLEVSVVVGIGFAVLESAYVFADAAASISLVTALLRAFGAGMMHGICTLTVGFGLSFVRSNRKILLAGTATLLSAAFVYHSAYNTLVLSGYTLIGVLLPTVTLALLLLLMRKRNAQERPDQTE